MYISPIDLLGITVPELNELDEQGIIRLEKKIKAQQLLDDQHLNTEEHFKILEALRNEEDRSVIFYIERHPKLKKFLTTGIGLEKHVFRPDVFFLDSNEIDKASMQQFLSPYFIELLIPKIQSDIQKNHFDHVLFAIEHTGFFSELVLSNIQEIVNNKLELTSELIEIVDENTLQRIDYIKNKKFAQLITMMPIGTIKDNLRTFLFNADDLLSDKKNISKKKRKTIKRCFWNLMQLKLDDSDLDMLIGRRFLAIYIFKGFFRIIGESFKGIFDEVEGKSPLVKLFVILFTIIIIVVYLPYYLLKRLFVFLYRKLKELITGKKYDPIENYLNSLEDEESSDQDQIDDFDYDNTIDESEDVTRITPEPNLEEEISAIFQDSDNEIDETKDEEEDGVPKGCVNVGCFIIAIIVISAVYKLIRFVANI